MCYWICCLAKFGYDQRGDKSENKVYVTKKAFQIPNFWIRSQKPGHQNYSRFEDNRYSAIYIIWSICGNYLSEIIKVVTRFKIWKKNLNVFEKLAKKIYLKLKTWLLKIIKHLSKRLTVHVMSSQNLEMSNRNWIHYWRNFPLVSIKLAARWYNFKRLVQNNFQTVQCTVVVIYWESLSKLHRGSH